MNQTEILIPVPQVKAGTVPYMQGSFVLGTLSFPEYVFCSRKSLKPNVETVKHSKCCRNQTGFKYDGWSRFSQLKLLHKGPSHHANPPQNATVNILLPGCWPVVLVHRQRGAALCWLQSRIYSLLRTRPQLLSAEKRSNSGSKKSQNYQHVPNKKSFFITLASLSWVKSVWAFYRFVARSIPQYFGGDPPLSSRDSWLQREAAATVLYFLTEPEVRDERSDVTQCAWSRQEDVSRFEVTMDYRRWSKKVLSFVLTL